MSENWKKILKIAWPLIIANSFWNIQLTIDRIFLGQYSMEALGAAMAVMGVFWTPMALLQQTSAYVTTFVAQYFGAKKFTEIGASVWHSIYMACIGGVLFLLLIFVSDSFFSFFGHSPKVTQFEVDYFNAICYSALPTAIVAALSGFFTGLGDTKTVMLFNGTALIFNVVFDYLLIFGNFGFPELGITGAGYATTIANWAGVILGVFLVFTKENEKKYKIRSGFRWKTDLIHRYIKFGVPSGLQWALEGLAFTAFLIFTGRFVNGDAALASSSIAVTVMMLAILPTLGVAQAIMVLVGQSLGNQKSAEAEKDTFTGLQISALYMFLIGSTFWLFPEFYIGWFKNSENIALWQQVESIIPTLLLFVAAFTIFDSMNLCFSFALKGAGDTRFVSLMALIIPWPIMVLPTYLVRNMDNAVFLSWGAASVFIILQALIFWRRFMGGKWKKMKVI